MERAVLNNHFNDNNIIIPLQSGFIPGDSITNQLTFLYDTFCQALDAGKEVQVVFYDISKAFDRVLHTDALQKQSRRLVFLDIFLDGLIHTLLTARPIKVELCSGWCTTRINTGATFVFIIFKR